MFGEKTVFHEYLRIVPFRDGGLVYLAQPVGRFPPTPFRLILATPTELVFENPDHDFPQRIRYQLLNEGRTLVATVDGQENGEHRAEETRLTRSVLVAP